MLSIPAGSIVVVKTAAPISLNGVDFELGRTVEESHGAGSG